MYRINITTVTELKKQPQWPHLRDDVKFWLKKVYETDFIKHSDGVSWISEFSYVPYFPPAVVHDWFYSKHNMTRKQADEWFRDAMFDWGLGDYGRVYFIALRLTGWFAWWNSHRKYKRRMRKRARLFKVHPSPSCSKL